MVTKVLVALLQSGLVPRELKIKTHPQLLDSISVKAVRPVYTNDLYAELIGVYIDKGKRAQYIKQLICLTSWALYKHCQGGVALWDRFCAQCWCHDEVETNLMDCRLGMAEQTV